MRDGEACPIPSQLQACDEYILQSWTFVKLYHWEAPGTEQLHDLNVFDLCKLAPYQIYSKHVVNLPPQN